MSDNSGKKRLQQIFVIGSGLAFLAIMTLPMLNMTSPPPATSNANKATAQVAEQQAQLKKIAQGYEQVLQREPNNPTALQGLVEARLKLNDLQGAVAPMEKLTSLYPQEPQLKTLLDAIKQQISLQKTQPTTPPAQPNP